jgi:hypothetical protein
LTAGSPETQKARRLFHTIDDRMNLMIEGEIKPGDELLFQHGNHDTAKVRVISILTMHGEKVIIVSINNEPPVHIDEDLLRMQCVPQKKAETQH